MSRSFKLLTTFANNINKTTKPLTTTSKRSFRDRQPADPFTHPKKPQPESRRSRVLREGGAQRDHKQPKYTIIALNGGGPKVQTHTNPVIMATKPHDSNYRLSGKVLQHFKHGGYIKSCKFKESIWYHVKNVDLKGYIHFGAGQPVTFSLTKYNGRTVAAHVRPLVQKFYEPTLVSLKDGAVTLPPGRSRMLAHLNDVIAKGPVPDVRQV